MLLTIFALLGMAAPPASAPNDLLDQGYRAMYNLDFQTAHRDFQDWERLHPDDPFGPASDAAAYLFFEFDRLNILRSEFFTEDSVFSKAKRLKPDPQVKNSFEAALEKSKKLSEAKMQNEQAVERGMFATVVRIALHADYLALIEKQYWQSLTEIKEARTDADALLRKCPDCYDANLAVGVENYLLSQKAAPLRLILRISGAQTDMRMGIAKLQIVADKGHYLSPYAKILLAIAALRDNRRAEARTLVAELARQFPGNSLFKDELGKLSCTANC